jgi:hypothetical protein
MMPLLPGRRVGIFSVRVAKYKKKFLELRKTQYKYRPGSFDEGDGIICDKIDRVSCEHEWSRVLREKFAVHQRRFTAASCITGEQDEICPFADGA